ncbi:MAG: signal peptidase II [Thermoguttaceae bacterium]
MKQPVPLSRYLVFFALAGVVCALDLATKRWMFDRLSWREIWWLWDGKFGFQLSLNEGALTGIGQGLWPLFAALSVGAAVAILIWLFAVGAARDWLLNVALALVMGGILGNLYDRLGLPGLTWPEGIPGHPAGTTIHAVRDFVLMAAGQWHWPNYNLADSALVCGAGLLICHALFVKTEPESPTDDQAAGSDS